MKSTSIRLTGAVIAVVAFTGVSTYGAPHASATPSQKVTICHATNSQTNPYVKITVNSSSINGQNNAAYNGHGDHDGTVWHQGIAAHSWGDIIPPFESPKGTTYPGSNWSSNGQSIYNNGCHVVAATTSTVQPTTPGASHTPSTPVKSTPVHTGATEVADSSDSPVIRQLPVTGANPLRVVFMGLLASIATYGTAYILKRR